MLLLQLNIDMPRQELSSLLTVRAVGLGMAMITMMGASVSALPPHLVPDGIAFRTIVQRVGSALGLAALSAVVAVDRAQGFANRTVRLDVSLSYHSPRIIHMQHQGPRGLIPLWEVQQARSLAQGYGDVYLILGIITLLCTVFAFVPRWAGPLGTDSNLVEVGT
jgi:hypothetical protein